MKTPIGIIVMAAWISLSLQEDLTTATTPTTETTTTATATGTPTTATTAAATGTPSTATTAASTVTATTSAPVDPNQRPVTASCQATYNSCKTGPTTPPGYCAAYTNAKSCIEASKNCISPDNATLQVFDCGPQDFYKVTIRSVCLDWITECLAQDYADKKTLAIQDFKTLFCAVESKGDCIKKDVSKCNATEVTTALKLACSAPQALLSSALFISLAFMLQRLMKDY